MNRKKRCSASRLRQHSSSKSSPESTEECHRSFDFVQAGNHSKALKLATSTVSRHPHSALAYNTLALIHFKISISSKSTKREQLISAVHSAKRAVALSPNSISFLFFHAVFLFELTQHDAASRSGYPDYEPVIEECERALSLENLRDPLEDNLEMDEKEPEYSNIELRIEAVKKKLKELLEKAKRKKLKNLVVEDNSFAGINKKIQAIQDRKAEIQMRFVTAKMSFERNLNSKVDTRAMAYWKKAMSLEAKKEFLTVGIEDLKSHFNKNKALAAKAKEVLAEAVEYMKETKSWNFSECCCCGKRFLDCESHEEHVKSVHLGTLSEELQSVVPESIVLNSVHEAVNLEDWKPVDLVAAAKLIENLPRNESGYLKMVNWPYCDDTNRYIIINKIQLLLRSYLAKECFAMSLFYMLKRTTRVMLENRIPKPVLEQHWSNKTLHLICFLEEPELLYIFDFLVKNLEISCGLRCLYNSFAVDIARGELISSYERVVISDDFSCLVFDERMLRGEIIQEIDETGNVDESKNDGEEDIEAIIHWLFASGSTLFRDKLKGWTSFREASKNQGMEYFSILQTEFCQLQKMCKRKHELLGYQKSWETIEEICYEEENRRKEIPGYNPQSYKSLLLKLQKDIEAEKGDDEMDSFGLELDNISCILKKIQVDSDKELFIKMHRITAKLLKLDAIIMVTITAMQQTWKKLEMVTTYDYRSIVVPLLKSFMRAQLEDIVDKDAAEKSNAAGEALLSELALDDKNIEKGGNDARQRQGKLKDNKKKKVHRKAKEFKVTRGSEEQQENVEQISFPVAHCKDYPLNPEIVGPVTNDELEKEEWELKAEEEYRMLEMNLELQMQIEYEAKQKRLAELNKAETSAGNMAEDVPFNGINFGTFDWIDFDQRSANQIGLEIK